MENKEVLENIVKNVQKGELFDAKKQFQEAIHNRSMDQIASRQAELSKDLAK